MEYDFVVTTLSRFINTAYRAYCISNFRIFRSRVVDRLASIPQKKLWMTGNSGPGTKWCG